MVHEFLCVVVFFPWSIVAELIRSNRIVIFTQLLLYRGLTGNINTFNYLLADYNFEGKRKPVFAGL